MKLTPKTIAVLKNFNSINPSICFDPGSTLRTMSLTKSVIAQADVDVKFDTSFCIYDISRFLNVLGLLQDPEIEASERTVTIKNDKANITYMCASRNLIVTAPDPKKTLILPEKSICSFTLKNDDVQQLLKAMAILGLPEIAIVGEEGKLHLKGVDSDGKIQDSYSLTIGENKKNFKAIFKTDNFNKLMPGDYNVRIDKLKGVNISHFRNDADKIEYYIAVDQSSDL